MNTEKKCLQMYDIQRFATMETTTLETLSDELERYYEKLLIDLAELKLVYSRFGDKYPIPQNGDKTIEFRKYVSLPKATTPITEGVTPDGDEFNVTSVTATVRRFGNRIQLSDILDLTAIDNNVLQATKLLGLQAGRTLDTITREVLCGGTNVIYAPILTYTDGKVTGKTEVTSRSQITAAATLTPDLFFQAAAQLDAFNAEPINDSYVAIVHPYTAYDLMRSDEWIEVHKYARPDNIYEGEIGKIGNVRFVKSTEAKITDGGADGTKVFCTIVLGAHAYGVTEITGGGLKHIVKQLGYGDDPLDRRSSAGWKAAYAAKRLVEQYMIRIESGSSYLSRAEVN